MPAKGASTKLVAPRLPPLRNFRVRRPNPPKDNPCATIMASVLSCWASTGHSIAGCAAIEQQLRACMDEPRVKTEKKNTINYHLGRLYRKLAPPSKRRK